MKRAGDLVGKLFRNIDSTEMQTYGELFSSWRAVAGTDIAAHSRILELTRGVLFIGVDHPGWMQILNMRKGDLLSSLAKRYPSLEIRNLRLLLIDGVPEEELKRRFSGNEPSAESDDQLSGSPETDASPEEKAEGKAEPPEDFRKKLAKLGRSIEEKWK
jgi:Dna[CI] antecedent, DciA